MKINISCKKIFAIIVDYTILFLLLFSFPANYYMMSNEWGIYNNDPDYTWICPDRVCHGPSPIGRTVFMIISPISAPLNALIQLVETTCVPSIECVPTR